MVSTRADSNAVGENLLPIAYVAALSGVLAVVVVIFIIVIIKCIKDRIHMKKLLKEIPTIDHNINKRQNTEGFSLSDNTAYGTVKDLRL